MPAITVIKFRKGTAAAWASANSVLAAGEPGLETDTNKFKFGDGTTAWNSLDYAGGGTASVVVSDTTPADPTADMVWFNSAEASAYIYYDSTWVPLSPGIAGPAGPTGIIVSDTAPTNTAQLWADPNATGSYIVPANGSKGQVLAKVTDTSYDTGWVTPQGSGNAIINGAFDINQRNFTSSTTSNGFGFDRWFATIEGDGTATYSAQTFTPGTAPVSGYEAANFARLVTSGQTLTTVETRLSHRVEDVRTFAGQTVTVSFWAKAGSGTPNIAANLGQIFGSGGSSSVIVSGKKTAISTSWARYSFTFELPSMSGKTIGTGSNIRLSIWVSAGSNRNTDSDSLGIQSGTFDIWGVQLEAGSIATPFRRNAPSIQAELAACQRYYWRASNVSNYSPYGSGFANATNAATILINLPTTMRSLPNSIEFSNIGYYDGVTMTAAVNPIIAQGNNSKITLYDASITGLTQYRPYNLIGNNNSLNYFALSAEL